MLLSFSSDWDSSLTSVPSQIDRSLRIVCVVENRKVGLLLYGWDSTGFDTLWGVPQTSPFLTTTNRRVSLALETCFAELQIRDYLLSFGDDTVHYSGSGPHKTDLQPSSLYEMTGWFTEVSLPQRERDSIRLLAPPSFILSPDSHHSPLRYSNFAVVFHRRRQIEVSHGMGIRFRVMGLASPPYEIDSIPCPIASKPACVWGNLAIVAALLMIIGGFTGVTTEADLHPMFYFSCAKSVLTIYLPVGSSGPDLYPSSSSPEEKILPPFPLPMERDVSSDSFSSVCFSSFVGLLSCGAVSMEPEDATESTLVLLADEVWTLTSLYVTILQLFDFVVKALLTYSSFVLNSLSTSIEDLSFLCYLSVAFSVYDQRR